MSTDRSSRDATTTDAPGDVPRIPPVVDWICSALIALAGVALAVGGAVVLFVVDQPEFATGIAEGARGSTFLSEAEMVDVALTTGTWTGWGLVVTGGLAIVAAGAYALRRRRDHARARDGESTNDTLANAVVGAVVSVVLAFLPISPAIGGAVAGYFERGESQRVVGVGALSGVLASSPLVPIVGFVVAGVAVGLFGVQQSGLAAIVVLTGLFSVMVVVTVGAALGALGGYVGGWLAGE